VIELSRSNLRLALSRSNVKVAVLPAALALAFAGAPKQPAVVGVRVWTESGVAERATGTVVGDGRVLTVEHVLAGARRVEVDGRAAQVLRRRPELDLAVLRVAGVSGPPVRHGSAERDLRVLTLSGAKPAALNRRVVAHLVDAPGRPHRPSLDLAASIAAGDSGAPVVDRDGRVVGVVYARSTRRDAAYAVRVGG
jgi:S1-C subfamily serine protease